MKEPYSVSQARHEDVCIYIEKQKTNEAKMMLFVRLFICRRRSFRRPFLFLPFRVAHDLLAIFCGVKMLLRVRNSGRQSDLPVAPARGNNEAEIICYRFTRAITNSDSQVGFYEAVAGL